jgi:hypothetical protein
MPGQLRKTSAQSQARGIHFEISFSLDPLAALCHTPACLRREANEGSGPSQPAMGIGWQILRKMPQLNQGRQLASKSPD